MKIEEVAKKMKQNIGHRDYPTNQTFAVNGNSQLYVNITTAVNGFVVNANGQQALCSDIGQLQSFLEELYAGL